MVLHRTHQGEVALGTNAAFRRTLALADTLWAGVTLEFGSTTLDMSALGRQLRGHAGGVVGRGRRTGRRRAGHEAPRRCRNIPKFSPRNCISYVKMCACYKRKTSQEEHQRHPVFLVSHLCSCFAKQKVAAVARWDRDHCSVQRVCQDTGSLRRGLDERTPDRR